MIPFTDKELKKYEAEIRYKPLPMLYQELDAVIKDPTPERQNIVKARIAALEDRERRIRNAKEREEEKRRANSPFDKTELIGFLFLIAATFAFCIIILLLGSGHGGRGLIDEIIRNPSLIANLKLRPLLSIAKYLPAIGIFLWYSTYIPLFRVYVWRYESSPSNDVPSYWLRNFKLALCIASYFFFFAIETFVRGDYNGFFFSCLGLPAYIVGGSYLISSVLFIANTFYPLSKKFRPKNGLTLLAFAAAIELIAKYVF